MAVNGHDHFSSSAQPPHSLSAEQAVLGSLLLDPTALPSMAAVLQARDFACLEHALVYQTLVELAAQGEATYVALTEELERLGLLELLGGRGYLLRLAASMPLGYDALQYAELVAYLAKRRREAARREAHGQT